MEFDNLEVAFPWEITRIRSDLVPRPLESQDEHKGGATPSRKPIPHWSGVHRIVCTVLDEMGKASALAQGLNHVVTSSEKLRHSEEQVVYILVLHSRVAGLLKVGRKNLFLLDKSGKLNEKFPLCILDFYVAESLQRSGLGNKLFQAMLKDQEDIHPRFLAIDRPSPKLISFFAKHYQLIQNIPQVNHYHIFQGFFTDRPQEEEGNAQAKRPRLYMGKLQYI
ncbi:alpha-tubulin N-acetyltransferase-like [Lepeophtheirus salmonis]|uniref:alpha-tubulin N-acetyltransferase-like n=1 Tax=Lepeophtheirus salmonis TaxID=72036 RepID=UPI001AE42C60|nr:alpha-tubulin N-acetyltransferase-like [Lepeophtheirus salmonis]